MRSPVDRRSRRSTALAVGALIALAACTTATSGTDAPASSSSPLDQPTVQSQPPTLISGENLQTKWPIKHVVILMQENRSFDHMFGTFPGADGASVGWDDGHRRPLTHLTAQRIPDLPHCWVCATADYNNGKMDGFSQDPISDKYAYTQLHRSD